MCSLLNKVWCLCSKLWVNLIVTRVLSVPIPKLITLFLCDAPDIPCLVVGMCVCVYCWAMPCFEASRRIHFGNWPSFGTWPHCRHFHFYKYFMGVGLAWAFSHKVSSRKSQRLSFQVSVWSQTWYNMQRLWKVKLIVFSLWMIACIDSSTCVDHWGEDGVHNLTTRLLISL